MPPVAEAPAQEKQYDPQFLEQKQKAKPEGGYTLSNTKPSLYEKETEKEAYHRITNRIYNQMLPERQKYDPEMQEIQDAYEGLLRMSRDPNTIASKVFPLVFMLVDAKLSTILAGRPRAVFEHTVEKAKIPFIEMMYEFYTSDADNGTDEEVIDYIWNWYNELYGWSIKRIWFEVDQWMEYDEQVVTETDAEGVERIKYDADNHASMTYSRCLKRKGKIRQRVYKPDMVAVDPDAMFLYEANDIVFIEDMSFDEWSVKFQDNPRYSKTEFVMPGKYMAPASEAMFAAQDGDGNLAFYHAKTNIGADKVRVVEYYNIARDEYAVFFNGVLCLHVPNPTPPVDGKKVLPAADLHNRLRPGTFYSRGEGKVVEPIVVMWQRLLNAKARRAELAASPVVLTDMPSGIAPKSFKVMPGAHWKGMKGRADILNLAGQDTGEVTEYLTILRDLAKATTGVDFDRFIAEPDPTAQQQLARESASKLRTEKDTKLRETLGYVRSMKILLATMQKFVPIPEIARIIDATPEQVQDLKDYDKIDADTFYDYPKIPLKDKFFIEEVYDNETKKLDLKATRSRVVKAKDYFFARPEFVRTRSPVRVRAVSDRKQSSSRALRLEQARELMDRAFGLPPKNDYEIQNAIATQQPPPKPDFFINRANATESFLDALGEDVKRMTESEADTYKNRPAMKLINEVFKGKPPTIMPNPDQQKEAQAKVQEQGVTAMSATPSKPSNVDLMSAGIAQPQPAQNNKTLPEVVDAVTK